MTTLMNYDQTIKVGDLITAYHKGFWQVTEVQRRFLTDYDVATYSSYRDYKAGYEYNPVIHYKQVATAGFVKTSGKKIKSCDASFCRKISEEYFAKLRVDLEKQIAALEQLRKDCLG